MSTACAPGQDQLEEQPYTHTPDTEPIPGYRLLHPLGRGGFGEVWKCEAPGGLLKAIKFVQGGLHVLDTNVPADEELRAIQRVKAIRHPFILTMERVESIGNELVIVMELADKSLGDVFDEERKAGKVGIAREPLLGYLREAAEVLDLMNTHHKLQHLDIKPRNLFLISDHVKVGDFGLVSNMSGVGGTQGPIELGAITPLYASPEVFRGSISQHSDQYSLAIVYQELLTGTMPFTGKNSRQLLMQHLQAEPNLEALNDTDRAVIARALSKNFVDRYPSCSDFIQALVAGQPEVVTATTVFVPAVTDPPAKDQDTRPTKVVKTIPIQSVRAKPVTRTPEGQANKLTIMDLVSQTPMSEVWNAKGKDDVPYIVKVLFRCPPPKDQNVAELATFAHPILLPIDVVAHTPGRLALATPAHERTLKDLLTEYQSNGSPGLPQEMVLDLLHDVCEGLTELATAYRLQHLGLNLKSLVLHDGRVHLLDFGIAELIWRPMKLSIAKLNSRYSAPELANNTVSPTCDVYSLALVYHELRTGRIPQAKPGSTEFDLERLLPEERPVIARALEPDPNKRWASPAEWLAAFREGKQPPAEAAPAQKRSYTQISRPNIPTIPKEHLQSAGEVMKTRLTTSLPADQTSPRLEAFREQWQAQMVATNDNVVLYRMEAPKTFWQRTSGQQATLEIQVTFGTLDPAQHAQARTEVHMAVRPVDCPAEQGAELLKGIGPLLVESMRSHLHVNVCGRAQERVVWPNPLQVCSILPDGTFGPAVDCHGKDISLNGIGFYLPGELPTTEVMLHLPESPQTPKISLRAHIVRSRKYGNDWHEIGAILHPPDELPPDEDGEEGAVP